MSPGSMKVALYARCGVSPNHQQQLLCEPFLPESPYLHQSIQMVGYCSLYLMQTLISR